MITANHMLRCDSFSPCTSAATLAQLLSSARALHSAEEDSVPGIQMLQAAAETLHHTSCMISYQSQKLPMLELIGTLLQAASFTWTSMSRSALLPSSVGDG